MGGRNLWKIFNLILLIGTVIGIFQPAFLENKSITQIIVSLLEPEASQGFMMRWLLVIGMFGSAYLLVISRVYRNVPITVIRTKYELVFLEDDGSVVEINREQLLRANRPDVSAYYSRHLPEYGRIPEHGISSYVFSSYYTDLDCDTELSKDGNGYEALQLFRPNLPNSWYMPLVPVRIINREYEDLPKFIRKNIVVRRQRVRYENEYNVPKPTAEVVAQAYVQMNFTVILRFKDRIPPDLKIRRIQNAGVVTVHYDSNTQTNVVQVRITRLKNETLRITWNRSEPVSTSSVTPISIGSPGQPA
jgi:hypothetical protein